MRRLRLYIRHAEMPNGLPVHFKRPSGGYPLHTGYSAFASGHPLADQRILNRYPNRPFQIAVQPSHAEAVEKFVPRPPEKIVTPQRAVGYWLSFLPDHLVCLTTNWDRNLFDLDTARQGIVRELRALEEKQPELVTAPDIQKGLMWAYGTARVAPDDAMRHWSTILARGGPLSLGVAEHALASTRTLESLERVWAQLQPLIPRAAKVPGMLSMLDVFYAQRLICLGAYDAALAVAKNYPLHPYLAWLLRKDDAQLLARDTDKSSGSHVARNRKTAVALSRNGLDTEDIIHVLSVNSHFKMQIGRRHERHEVMKNHIDM
ncbi:hypothetical protein EXIGLDRAFT_807788 [Exidia glandulosa HHB12029]|uniref:Uncharacterized protein n=1 Tax=Exidia glandulosa HHB12029 TaxID=1314781 RepID=A0A165LYD6_EXIGL|nr:hypothetical protein EXIGLDRAFT_807788 [Exidia glandulosa HHB12029]